MHFLNLILILIVDCNTMKTITIRVSEELEQELTKSSEESGSSRSELVREALQNHLGVQKFKRLRSKIKPFAEKQDYLIDEDVFNDPEIS